VLTEVLAKITDLRTNSYGNYVVSHILEFGGEKDKSKIIEEIIDDIVELSLHKFGSNVVEKCLMFAPAYQKKEIIDRIVSAPPVHANHSNTLAELM
jgi:hypothetical protein